MVRALKTMFGGYSGYIGRDNKLKVDTFYLRTGVDMTRKRYTGYKTIKIGNLNIRRK